MTTNKKKVPKNGTRFACLVVFSLTALMVGCAGGITGDQGMPANAATTSPDVMGAGVSASMNMDRFQPSLGAAIDSSENSAPVIEAISLGCDLVVDSVVISDAEVTSFTVNVDDESPLTLSYSVSSDDASIALASVDENGVFSLTGLLEGSTSILVAVTDGHGASDQLLLKVIVAS